MDCPTCQDRLPEYSGGGLSPDERRAVGEHIGACAECGELYELLRLEAQAPPDLADSILRRTSGSACGRAGDLLAEHTDGTLVGLDFELLRLHLDGCVACGALAAVLKRLPVELAAMSTLEPDARLLSDVLAATVGQRSRLRTVGIQWLRGWAALLERPRIAWEAGYVGAMTVWLLFGPTLAPLLAAPSRLAAPDLGLTFEVKSQLESLGSQAWQATAAKGLEVKRDCAQGYRRAAGAIDHGSRRALHDLTDGASMVWKRIVSDLDESKHDETNEGVNR